MNVPRTLGKLMAWSVISRIIALLGISYFTQNLGADGIGSYFLFESIVILSTIIGDLGISTSVEKRISNGNNPSKVMLSGSALLLVITLSIISLLFLFKHQVHNYVGLEVLPALVVAILFRQIVRLLRASLRGAQRVGETAIFDGIDKTVWLGTGGILINSGYGVRAPVYGLIAGAFCVSVFSTIRLRPELVLPTKDSIMKIVKVAKWSSISDLGGAAYNWLDVVLLGILAGQSAVGIYEVAWRVAAASLLFSQAVRKTAFPKIVAEGGPDNKDRIEDQFTQFITPSVYFVIPSLIGASIIGEELLVLVFGTEFGAGAFVLTLLMVEKVQRSFSYILIPPAFALNRADIDAKSTAVGIISNLILNTILIYSFGIVGAAVATLLSETTNFGIQYWYLSKHIDISLPWRELVGMAASSFIMGVCVVLVTIYHPIESILGLIMIIFTGAAVYILATISDPVLRGRARNSLSENTNAL